MILMRKPSPKYLAVAIQIFILLLLTLVIYLLDLDLKVQRLFYQPDAAGSVWYQKDNAFWQFGYHYGTLPAILLSFGALIGLILSWIKPKIKRFRKHFLLIIFTLLIGPGLVVNAIFKDHWGRPRPRQIQEFGGRWEFKQVWERGIPGKGKSFPCGHCSMGFFFVTLYYAFKRKRKLLAYASLIFSIALGIFIGFARISQGGHFLSDVLWAWGFTYITASVLYYFVLKIPNQQPDGNSKISPKVRSGIDPCKRIVVVIAIIAATGLMVFTFLFSKPFYRESIHKITTNQPAQYIKLLLNVDHGDILIHSGSFEIPITIKTVARGFGFPEYTYRSKVSKQHSNDTLFVNYLLQIKGLFNEIDVETSIRIDTSQQVNISGLLTKGTVLLDKTISDKIAIDDALVTSTK